MLFRSSPKLKGIRLLQELLRFHKEPGSDPRLHAELERIRFVRNLGVGEEKDSREESLLRGFAEANAKHPLSAKAREDWARILVSQNELDTAHKIALQGKNAFPESIGGKLCHNLIQSIESKTVTVATERSWNNPDRKSTRLNSSHSSVSRMPSSA